MMLRKSMVYPLISYNSLTSRLTALYIGGGSHIQMLFILEQRYVFYEQFLEACYLGCEKSQFKSERVIYIYVVPYKVPSPTRRNLPIRHQFRDRRHIGSLHGNSSLLACRRWEVVTYAEFVIISYY
jgi:hypothetical protein